ncbi:MAG: hypothetical protein L3J39_17775 [Verrucomicrobiales bacterium]|nr:hypothetical protein [Verrucomicrobiales bacterium]
MEFTFTPIRIVIFICLLASFWFLGGFTHPATRLGLAEDAPIYLLRSWGFCMTLFIVGATSATLVEHWVGNLDPTNLQTFYITMGIIAMSVAVIWNHTIVNYFVLG